MIQRVLAFEQAPSLMTPLRFFLAAPLFVLAAAILLFWQGPAALVSRWSPVTLALTHLLTLGALAGTMIGALMQILPVVAGVALPRANATATGVHALLMLGTAALAAAFWRGQPLLFQLAMACLVTAFGWLLGACAVGLWHARRQAGNVTVRTVRLALAALAITIGLGATLASGFAWPLSLPLLLLTDLHVAWGLLGWVGLLVIGVAFQVIPMFQVTPVYPLRVTRWLGPLLLGLLVLWSGAVLLSRDSAHWSASAVALLLLLGYLGFTLTTLHLLGQRKRPQPDATTWFWRASMASLLLCTALWLLHSNGNDPRLSLTLGILFIVGFAWSAINGMLYKIVPFLVWYHLQHSAAPGRRGPSVKEVLADRLALRQFVAHVAALLLLTGATLWPPLVHPAALALALSAGWLWLNLLQATRLYLRVKRQIESPLVVA